MVIDAESWNPFYRYPHNLHISLTLDPVYLTHPDTEGQKEAGISADGITSTGQCSVAMILSGDTSQALNSEH